MESAFANPELYKKASFALPELDARGKERRTSHALSSSPLPKAMARAISPTSLKKQATISMNALEMALHRRFDPRFMLSEFDKQAGDKAYAEVQDASEDKDSGMGQLLLDKALSVPTSARTRGLQAPFKKSSKSIAVELMTDPIPAVPLQSSPDGRNKLPANQGQMMEMYLTAVQDLSRKRNKETAKAKLNAPEMQSGSSQLCILIHNADSY